jgi:hypothetical protein
VILAIHRGCRGVLSACAKLEIHFVIVVIPIPEVKKGFHAGFNRSSQILRICGGLLHDV